jgi:serine/threonine protein kinase
MNCPHCTTPIPEQSRFCLSCGVNVSGETGELTLEFDPGLQTRLQQDLGSEFVVERELGRGGMAVVYLAHDMRLGRKVAIKVLPPELTFGKPESVERFRREARTAATLDHPNVIPIYRVSGNGPLVWYVMKYLEGESLDQVLRRVFRFSVDATVRIIEQVAAALEHAHERGVVHRDVKPANLVIDSKGRVTVTDFGIAKAMDSPLLTASGAAMGTPFYMSPEQCAGDAITGASDQYALAVMTYQMLCGRVPFTGQSVIDIVKKHCLDKVPSLQELQPDLSAPVAAVVERALAKQPAERFPSVTSFAKALQLTARGVDVGASYPRLSDPLRGAETLMIDPKQ